MVDDVSEKRGEKILWTEGALQIPKMKKMSEIGVQGFYMNKKILITGASGFLGICLLEKILRTIPQHGDIYLLLRPKKGKSIAERLEEIKKNQIFEPLLKEKSVDQVFEYVEAIAGDVGEDNLGLSEVDSSKLKHEVNVIFHSAATLDFGDTLKTTIDINLLGTRRVAKFAKECRKLSVLVHVSSAYVNSWRTETCDEVIYPLKTNGEDLIASVNKLSPEELEEQTPELLGNHPNTYTITKHLAEFEIEQVENIFPCVIVRPSMIVGAWKEPVPGWTISKNGPQGFMMGAAKGVVRRLPVGKRLVYDYIPVDLVVNTMLAGGFCAGVTKPNQVMIYHCTTSTRNPFRWCTVEEQINTYLHKYPLKSAVWYPHLKLLPSVKWYRISALFVHFFPAIILDTVARFSGGRPILMKLHRNVNSSLGRLEKFIFTEWRFSATKTMDLQDWLNDNDKRDFNLDVSSLVWEDYFNDLVLGARIYLNKEPLGTLKVAKKKDNILLGVHLAWQTAIFTLLWYIFSCVTGMDMMSAAYFLPILFILYNLM